jgi:hypothetical protein
MRRAGFQIREKDGSALVPGHPSHRNTHSAQLESRDPRSLPFLGPGSLRNHFVLHCPVRFFHRGHLLLSSSKQKKACPSPSMFRKARLFAGWDATGAAPRPWNQQDPKRATGDRLFRVQAACGCHATTPLRQISSCSALDGVQAGWKPPSNSCCNGEQDFLAWRPHFQASTKPFTPASSLHPWLSLGDFRGPGHGKG